mmetsp:Transcript_41692/g.100395  ORF Transcript_41692/g.100395 Transcript_41692/m.100395 type:complete len:144 (+) Transcript_41692:598-1029(+)
MDKLSKTIALLMVLLFVSRRNDQDTTTTTTYSSKSTTKSSSRRKTKYVPSRLEGRMMEVSRSEFHYDVEMADECDLYKNESRAFFQKEYHQYADMLDEYYKAVNNFHTDVGMSDCCQRRSGKNCANQWIKYCMEHSLQRNSVH